MRPQRKKATQEHRGKIYSKMGGQWASETARRSWRWQPDGDTGSLDKKDNTGDNT